MENSKKIKSNNANESCKKLDIARFFVECLQLILVITASMTLIFSIYPQLKPNNANLMERANAGDVKAQLQLAHFYYETGDYSESIYWYKMMIVSSDAGEYKALAYNNLGYLYSNGYGLATEAVSEEKRLNIALEFFEKSAELFSEKGNRLRSLKNQYVMLITFGDDIYDDYGSKVSEVVYSIRQCEGGEEIVIAPHRDVVSKEKIESPVALSAGWVDDNTFLVYSGASVLQIDSSYAGIRYTYEKIIYEDGSNDNQNVEYMDPKDLDR